MYNDIAFINCVQIIVLEQFNDKKINKICDFLIIYGSFLFIFDGYLIVTLPAVMQLET